jgi:SAM-dependent methyltransferase
MPNWPANEGSVVNEQEKLTTIARYNARLDQFGHDPRALGWPKRQHLLRYDVLLSYWTLASADLLDFGCGFGDMYAYCRDAGRADVRYHGIDINPRLIEKGSKRYPEADLTVRDVMVQGMPRSYDVIVCSGLYNFRLQDNWGFITRTFDLFRSSCTQGFAANFVTNRVDFREETLYYADPCAILNLCYKYSRRVLLRQDYMPFEFTVFVDLRDKFDKDYIVFPEFLRFIPNAEAKDL